jgi:hypothetical protein
MKLTLAMERKITDIYDAKEFLRTGRKIVDGEKYLVSDGSILVQCIKDYEAELGRMVFEEYMK